MSTLIQTNGVSAEAKSGDLMCKKNILPTLVKPCPWTTWLVSSESQKVFGSEEGMWNVALFPYPPALPFSESPFPPRGLGGRDMWVQFWACEESRVDPEPAKSTILGVHPSGRLVCFSIHAGARHIRTVPCKANLLHGKSNAPHPYLGFMITGNKQ